MARGQAMGTAIAVCHRIWGSPTNAPHLLGVRIFRPPRDFPPSAAPVSPRPVASGGAGAGLAARCLVSGPGGLAGPDRGRRAVFDRTTLGGGKCRPPAGQHPRGRPGSAVPALAAAHGRRLPPQKAPTLGPLRVVGQATPCQRPVGSLLALYLARPVPQAG